MRERRLWDGSRTPARAFQQETEFSSPGSKHWQVLGSCVAAANCGSPGHTAPGPAGPVILVRIGAKSHHTIGHDCRSCGKGNGQLARSVLPGTHTKFQCRAAGELQASVSVENSESGWKTGRDRQELSEMYW